MIGNAILLLHSFLFCLFSERYCGQKCGQIEIFGRICKWGESTNGFVMRNVGGVVAGLLGDHLPQVSPHRSLQDGQYKDHNP